MTQYPKSISDISQLVKKLSDAGMTLDVPNPEEALTTIGYYRLLLRRQQELRGYGDCP